MNFIDFSKLKNAREANEMYDAIKEGGSTRHLMRVPAQNYFLAYLHFQKLSIANLFLSPYLTTRFHFLQTRNKLYLQDPRQHKSLLPTQIT